MKSGPSSGPPLIAILGPTASGKTELSLLLAERLGATIIGCDSMQLYRGMDIGTAKADAAQQARAPHAMIDVLDIQEAANAARYAREAAAAIDAAQSTGRPCLLVGGTGMYAKLLLQGAEEALPADPALAASLRAEWADPAGARRLETELFEADEDCFSRVRDNPRRLLRALEILRLTGAAPPRRNLAHATHARPCREVVMLPDAEASAALIARRTSILLRSGWIEEAQTLIGQGLLQCPTASQAIGYAQIGAHLRGEAFCKFADLEQEITTRTRQYAKRQRTWFRQQHPAALKLDPLAHSLQALTERVLLHAQP